MIIDLFYQPAFWIYLKGDFLSFMVNNTRIHECLFEWRKKIESNSKNYKEFYRCR
jgi:hypothetical protein